MSKIETHLHTAECDKCAHVSAKDIVHLYKDAGYVWNASVPITVDAERFDELCSRKETDPDARLAQLEDLMEKKGMIK